MDILSKEEKDKAIAEATIAKIKRAISGDGTSFCPNCKKPFIEDWESSRNVIGKTGFITKKWDGHTYRASCKCLNENLRFSIG